MRCNFHYTIRYSEELRKHRLVFAYHGANHDLDCVFDVETGEYVCSGDIAGIPRSTYDVPIDAIISRHKADLSVDPRLVITDFITRQSS